MNEKYRNRSPRPARCNGGECREIDHVREMMGEHVEHLKELARVHLDYMVERNEEAKRLMEKRMTDFPDQFVHKGEVTGNLAVISSKVDQLMETRLLAVSLNEKMKSFSTEHTALLEFKGRSEGMATMVDLNIVRSKASMGQKISIASVIVTFLGLILHFLIMMRSGI